MKEVENILGILRETEKLINQGNFHEITILSDKTIHSATISQDPDNIIVAVLVYSIGKILERRNYKNMDGWDKFSSSASKNLNLTIKSLEKNDIENARTYLGRIRNSINTIDGALNIYIQDIFRKASINKASRLYEHGLSMGRTAELLGITKFELMDYIGKTYIADVRENITISPLERLKFVRSLFRWKH